MSDANPMAAFGDFGKWMPGFDFLKGLGQASGQGVPPLAGWVAPTLSVEELDKRIQELRTVLFWLEQNSTALKATIQAMEVQKMTLATLQGMNVSLQEMAQAFSAPMPAAAPAASAAPAWPPSPSAPSSSPSPPPSPSPAAARPAAGFAGLEVPPLKSSRSRKSAAAAAATAAPPADGTGQSAAAPGLVDPMQWWGALTQQFQHIAHSALKDAGAPSAAAPGLSALAAMPGMKAAAELAEQAGQVLAASTGRKPATKRNAAPARKTASARPATQAAKTPRPAPATARAATRRAGAAAPAKRSR